VIQAPGGRRRLKRRAESTNEHKHSSQESSQSKCATIGVSGPSLFVHCTWEVFRVLSGSHSIALLLWIYIVPRYLDIQSCSTWLEDILSRSDASAIESLSCHAPSIRYSSCHLQVRRPPVRLGPTPQLRVCSDTTHPKPILFTQQLRVLRNQMWGHLIYDFAYLTSQPRPTVFDSLLYPTTT